MNFLYSEYIEVGIFIKRGSIAKTYKLATTVQVEIGLDPICIEKFSNGSDKKYNLSRVDWTFILSNFNKRQSEYYTA